MENKEILDLEEKKREKSKFEGILTLIGLVCFICIVVIVILHLGFIDRSISYNTKPMYFLTKQQLWVTNSILGIIGGTFINFQKKVIMAICGLIIALSITGFSLLYFGWRTNILMVEIIIPLGLGVIPGIYIYNWHEKITLK